MRSRPVARRTVLGLLLGTAAVPLLAACSSTPSGGSAPTAAPAPAQSASGAASPSASLAASPAAAALTSAPAVTGALTAVRVGIIGATSDSGFFIADELGYFKEQGIDFQIISFQSGPDMVSPAGTGQLEVATGAPSAGLYNAIARGIPLRVVADKGEQQPNFIFSSIVLRKDLLDDHTISGWADLKGQKMAVAGLGNSGHIFLDRALQRGGLTWKDVELTTLSYADMGSALANKSIYGGVAIEPFRTQWPSRGIGGYLPDDGQIYLNQQAAVVMYGPQFIEKQPDVARRLMVAYLRGIRAYNDAFVKKVNREAVIDILTRRTTLTDRALYDQIGLPALDPNGKVLVDDLRAQQDWYMTNGYQTTAIDMTAAVDTSFTDAAVQQLGPYTA